MQAALSVLAGLLATLALMRVRVPLGLAFLAGAMLMGVGAGLGPAGTVEALAEAAAAAGTWLFAAVVSLVFVLSAMLARAGSLNVLVATAGGLISNRRLRLASLPALVGLLPMPGGALVSAPLVQASGEGLTLSSRDKNLINYWFRHVWEVFWPLYPPILLSATLLGGPVAVVSLVQLPLGIMLAVLGWLFVLRRIPAGKDTATASTPSGRAVARAALPFVLVIAGMPLFSRLLDRLAPGSGTGEAGLVVALVLAVLVTAFLGGWRLVPHALRERRTWSLMLAALGVVAFGSMVRTTGAAQSTSEMIRGAGIPALGAIMVLPFLCGLMAGNSLAYVAVSFPVVIALAGSGDWQADLPALMLAYACGFSGYMLSPLHLCLVLSSRFYGETITRAYTRLWVPMLLFMGLALAFYGVLRSLAT